MYIPPYERSKVIALKKAVLSIPDIDGAKAKVREKAEAYSQATVKISATLLAENAGKQYVNDILEWIWRASDTYLTPKTVDELGDAGQWFLNSSQYVAWVGDGPLTLVCSGQRICFLEPTDC